MKKKAFQPLQYDTDIDSYFSRHLLLLVTYCGPQLHTLSMSFENKTKVVRKPDGINCKHIHNHLNLTSCESNAN